MGVEVRALELLKTERTTHPLYWAPFVVSRGRSLVCEEYERNEDPPKEFWLDKTIAYWVIKL